ncbi:unnamed protein product [Kuraishia capsulata CBS 1993]|uniref:Nop domain-containing protein n=1 Tax=Kuraishia capsulata CBS 1993 TaxID=1382522 RepID=W6MIH2_9ASCO|nr:uncharacterized protein KUCA_T00001668001 [Kuraishia capsulata CBS 1993]CDK25698.1 unnamed protein product [Kuraishia capsulata CBS 1993]
MSAANLLGDLSSDEDENPSQEFESPDLTMEDGALELESEEVVRRASLHLKGIQKTIEGIEEAQSMEIDQIDKASEVAFLGKANSQLDEIANDIVEIHNFLRIHYTPVFPELSSLIGNPIEYCKIVRIIQNNLELASDENSRLKEFLSGDKILVISMSSSLLRQSHHDVRLSEREMAVVVGACDLVIQLDTAKLVITQYIASRAPILAPNLTVLLGPVVAAQMISTLGIQGLATVPACNLASLGSNRVVGTGIGGGGIRNKGYIYSAEIVQNVPEEFRQKAMRMLSAKVVLAARVDLSTKTDLNTYAGDLGDKWRRELVQKLDKFQAPPDNAATKALPLPVTAPSKKRGGRRFRKLKQQFEMSELAKAQNKMAFGDQEETITNAYGEEIGLGLAGKNSSSGVYRAISSSATTKAKMTKAMEKRLNKALEMGEGNSNLVRTLLSSDK